eukprot:s1858_g12.t1
MCCIAAANSLQKKRYRLFLLAHPPCHECICSSLQQRYSATAAAEYRAALQAAAKQPDMLVQSSMPSLPSPACARQAVSPAPTRSCERTAAKVDVWGEDFWG